MVKPATESQPTQPVFENYWAPEELPQATDVIETALRSIGVSQPMLAERSRVVKEILEMSSHLSLEDQAILLAIAEQESTFNPTVANNKSSAKGVFQFIDATWRGIGMEGKDPLDSRENVAAGVLLYEDHLRWRRNRGEPELHGGDKLVRMYTLHHDGTSGIDYGGETTAVNLVLPKYNRWKKVLSANP